MKRATNTLHSKAVTLHLILALQINIHSHCHTHTISIRWYLILATGSEMATKAVNVSSSNHRSNEWPTDQPTNQRIQFQSIKLYYIERLRTLIRSFAMSAYKRYITNQCAFDPNNNNNNNISIFQHNFDCHCLKS